MQKQLTVAELIAVLQTMPQDLPVEMGMCLEYQEEVTADMVEVFYSEDGKPEFVQITNMPGWQDLE